MKGSMKAAEGADAVEDDTDNSPSFHHAATDNSNLPPSTRNNLRLTVASFQTIRHSVGLGAAADIITGAYIDAGLITKDDNSKRVTKRKMQLETDRCLEDHEVRLFDDSNDTSVKIIFD